LHRSEQQPSQTILLTDVPVLTTVDSVSLTYWRRLGREGIVIMPTDRALTTQEAADFLNMSRQYLVELLERGEIPFTKTGTHRRVKFHDLLAYKERRDAQGREILDELTRLGQEMGDYSPPT
jgi:excisionase family DNA binding protein